MSDPENRSTRTRRCQVLTSLLFVATTSVGCDGPEVVPAVDSGAEEKPASPEPAEPADEGEEMKEPECEPAPVVRPRVMFVLDKSSSMTGSSPETGTPAEAGGLSRWGQLHAVVGALAEAMEGEAVMGAVLFPSTYAETAGSAVCDVRTVPEAAVGPYRAADLMALLPPVDAENFRGGSPAQAAYATALDHLETLGGAAPTVIVLVSDGGHNCADEAAPLAAVDEGFAELVAFARDSLQIQTFVIGVEVAPGDPAGMNGDPDAVLREIALAGGAALGERGYFTTADTRPLAQALGSFLHRGGDAATTTMCR